MNESRLTWPNRISIARICLVPVWVLCLLNMNHAWPGARRAALALYLVMAASDALDGFLARRWRQQSALGAFLDPLADKLLTTCAVILLAVEATAVPGARLPSWVPVIALGKDVLTVLGFALVYLATQRTLIRPRVLGKVSTLVQSVMVAATLLTPDLPGWWRGVVEASWAAASGAAILAWLDYLRLGIRFVSEVHAAGEAGRGSSGPS
ncbi:MAG: CDP-diacylglycerol--glycerol-3-phosphate 3-phosphatidyltransferase [Phycisphaerae bacterium]|nr:CDP-diacylglycerol--glycerol-3-phosphate 3-phosphatidyltransferase [Phycisphaerae bacterium]